MAKEAMDMINEKLKNYNLAQMQQMLKQLQQEKKRRTHKSKKKKR